MLNYLMGSLLFIFCNFSLFSQNLENDISPEEKFHNAQVGFDERWEDFEKDMKSFPIWNPTWKKEELKKRFKFIRNKCLAVYFIHPEDLDENNICWQRDEKYQTPQNWKLHQSRYPFPLACSYNLASSYYNASIVSIHGVNFLAMEAPKKENLNAFFQVIDDYKVSHLVRLTPISDDKGESCFPYWEGLIKSHPISLNPTLEIRGREVLYFPVDCWKNHEGFETKRLLALVKSVMASHEENSMIAVHCRAGVGRTGTFIAAYLLIQEIDRQIANGVDVDQLEVSIDKIVWKISLQRPFSVAHYPQYETLYQLVNDYTHSLKSP